MKRLLLMRHAKSDYPAGLSDHDRPLNRRGRLASALMGAWLREAGMIPDLALVSSAARAEETWERMKLETPAARLKSLYLADACTLLEAARQAPDDAETLLILAHQPGLEECADRLLDGERIEGYPTAKIAVLSFDVDHWRDAAFGAARLLAEAAPKQLV